MFEKSKLNFIIDPMMFLCMMAIVGLGFLMKFILIPGKERWVKYGRNVELQLMGMDRHEWGRIHLIIGFVLLSLLALHIILHWKVILGLFRKLFGQRRARRILASAFVILSLLLIIVPLSAKPEIQELGMGQEHDAHASADLDNKHASGCGGCPEMLIAQKAHAAEGHGEIRGFMTIAIVSDKYDVPTQYLKTHLGMPESASDNEKLGRLREIYKFTMTDVEEAVSKYREQNPDAPAQTTPHACPYEKR